MYGSGYAFLRVTSKQFFSFYWFSVRKSGVMVLTSSRVYSVSHFRSVTVFLRKSIIESERTSIPNIISEISPVQHCLQGIFSGSHGHGIRGFSGLNFPIV